MSAKRKMTVKKIVETKPPELKLKEHKFESLSPTYAIDPFPSTQLSAIEELYNALTRKTIISKPVMDKIYTNINYGSPAERKITIDCIKLILAKALPKIKLL